VLHSGVIGKKMNENISKYVKTVLKNTLKLHKKSYNTIKNRRELTYLYSVYIF